jgi:hypothetical protein
MANLQDTAGDIMLMEPDRFCSGTVALIDSLPPELLACIFEMAQIMSLSSGGLARLRRFPFIVSQVSRFWRHVALGCGMLWCDVDISPPWTRLDGLVFYLERSKSCLIDLTLIIPSSQNDLDVSNVDDLLSILNLQYHRCRTINISGTLHKIAPAVMKILTSMHLGQYPNMERIVVEGSDRDSGLDVGHPDSQIFISGAPKLADVRLGGIGLLYFQPPLGTVTELHLAREKRSISFNDFSRMLKACSALKTLAIYDDLVSDWPTPLQVHNVPSLRHLHIYGNMLSVSQLLLSVSAPDLEALSIAPVVASDLKLMCAEGKRNNKPWFPVLRSLTLAPPHPSAMKAVSVASECFPTTQLLILPNFYSESLVETFGLKANSLDGTHWPHLDGLAIREIQEKNEAAVYSLIESRRVAGDPLNKIYLDAVSIKRMTRLKWLEDQMLVVEADPWGQQQSNALHAYDRDRFYGESKRVILFFSSHSKGISSLHRNPLKLHSICHKRRRAGPHLILIYRVTACEPLQHRHINVVQSLPHLKVTKSPNARNISK